MSVKVCGDMGVGLHSWKKEISTNIQNVSDVEENLTS